MESRAIRALQRQVFPVNFSPPLLKTLLGQKLELADLAGVDAELHANLAKLRDMPESELEALDLAFVHQCQGS